MPSKFHAELVIPHIFVLMMPSSNSPFSLLVLALVSSGLLLPTLLLVLSVATMSKGAKSTLGFLLLPETVIDVHAHPLVVKPHKELHKPHKLLLQLLLVLHLLEPEVAKEQLTCRLDEQEELQHRQHHRQINQQKE